MYHCKPREPVIFDRPGIVTVACNSHGNRVGYLDSSGARVELPLEITAIARHMQGDTAVGASD